MKLELVARVPALTGTRPLALSLRSRGSILSLPEFPFETVGTSSPRLPRPRVIRPRAKRRQVGFQEKGARELTGKFIRVSGRLPQSSRQQGHSSLPESRHEPLLTDLSHIVSRVSHSQTPLALFRGDSRPILDRGHLNTHTQKGSF
jgi:hypothetical protein